MAADLIDRVGDGFRATFDREPAGIWSAPGRVSVSGDHTDVQDGLSFAFAIAERSAVAVSPRDDGAITIATDLSPERATASLATLQPGDGMDDWKAYPLGMIWAVVEHARGRAQDGDRDQGGNLCAVVGTGLDVFLSSDLPIGGGLASSASICAALGIALRDLWGLDLSNLDLAAIGRATEVHAAGATTGVADHMTVLTATEGHDVFYDVRGRDASLIAMPDHAGAKLVNVVVGTRELHRNWASGFRERHEACARVAEALGCQTLREVRLDDLEAARERLDEVDYRRARHVVTEIQRTLDLTCILRTEGPLHVGETVRASQASLRDDFEVSTERIDATCELAEHLGAIGARMSGSGLGGSVLALMPEDRVAEFREAVRALYAEHGWEEPTVEIASASPGARRDR